MLFGAGGVGKGTIARELVAADPQLSLSRSWTTRGRRPAERDDAYVFVERPDFEAAVDEGRFLEWAEYLGNLYGTPLGDPDRGTDLLLEIDLQGARSVRQLRPEAVLILLKAPSPAVQEERLRARGDDEAHIAERIRSGAEEEREGQLIADAVVVNDDVARATREVAGIVEGHRDATLEVAARPPDEQAEGS